MVRIHVPRTGLLNALDDDMKEPVCYLCKWGGEKIVIVLHSKLTIGWPLGWHTGNWLDPRTALMQSSKACCDGALTLVCEASESFGWLMEVDMWLGMTFVLRPTGLSTICTPALRRGRPWKCSFHLDALQELWLVVNSWTASVPVPALIDDQSSLNETLPLPSPPSFIAYVAWNIINAGTLLPYARNYL